MKFKRVFTNQGVNGIVGLLTDEKDNDIVFKVSQELDESILHEYLVLKDLATLNSEHFPKEKGLITKKVSKKFFEDPENNEMFDSNGVDTEILLMEYISRDSLDDIFDEHYKDRKIIFSLLVQILFALEDAQQKIQFTSYDIHLSNILIKKVEIEKMNKYVIKQKEYIIPTYGFLPVIIDFGSSYSKSVIGKPMRTKTYSYHKGIQSCIFDSLQDVHHLLVSAAESLENLDYNLYYWFRTRVLYYFRGVPMRSVSGWKILPSDIEEEAALKLEKLCQFSIWNNLYSKILNILNGLIILPLKPEINDENFIATAISLFTELQKLRNASLNDKDFLNKCKRIVQEVNNYNTSDRFNSAMIASRLIKFTNTKNNIDLKRLYNSAVIFGKLLSSFYYNQVTVNTEVISKGYSQNYLRSPIDAATFIMKNFNIYPSSFSHQ